MVLFMPTFLFLGPLKANFWGWVKGLEGIDYEVLTLKTQGQPIFALAFTESHISRPPCSESTQTRDFLSALGEA